MAAKKDKTLVTNSIVPTMYEVEGQDLQVREEEMTVYSALSKRKIYAKQLDALKATGGRNEFMYVNTRNQVAKEVNGYTVDEYENLLKSNYDKNVAILKNFYNINAAIAQSNAVTKINIGGVEYTVAEAIIRYSRINEEISFLNNIIKEVANARAKVSTYNTDKLNEDKITAHVKSMIQSLPETVQAALTDETTKVYEDRFREEYIARNTMVIVDPYDHCTHIKERVEALEMFKEGFNEALNVCNMQTIIKVCLVN